MLLYYKMFQLLISTCLSCIELNWRKTLVNLNRLRWFCVRTIAGAHTLRKLIYREYVRLDRISFHRATPFSTKAIITSHYFITWIIFTGFGSHNYLLMLVGIITLIVAQ